MVRKNNALKKILIIISSLKLGGGAERVAALTGNELMKKGHSVQFLTFYDSERKYETLGKQICLNERHTNNKLVKFIKVLNRLFLIKKICDSEKIDTTISFMEDANISNALTKYLNNKSKIIVSTHIDPKIYLNMPFVKPILRKVYNKADKVICVSEGIKKEFEKIGINNCHTIYNPLTTFTKKTKQNKTKQNKTKIYINIGRLDKQKGQKYLISAFNEVVKKQNNSELWILGEGPEKTELKQQIDSLNLTKKVSLKGAVDDVDKYLNKADCFVFTSIYEGFGLVLIEALNHNLPIISTDCDHGPREILAPELKVGQQVKYPYYSKYGVLVKKFDEKNNNKRKVDSLAQLMLDFRPCESGVERAKDFKPHKITKDWEKVI